MRKNRLKTGTIILLFSIVITGIFILMIVLFQNHFIQSLNQSTSSYYGVSLINNIQAKNMISDGSISLTPEDLSSISDFNAMYSSNLLSALFPLAIGFCAFLVIFSFLLSKILNKIRVKENSEVVHSLEKLLDVDKKAKDSRTFVETYRRIEAKFQNNFDDFKRLNAYLSHEQKNAIALLRTEIEINQDTTYLRHIEYLTNSIDNVLTLSDDSESNEIIDVSIVCAQIVDIYRINYPNISFHFPDEPSYIEAKERWIFRAISNLVDNAIKFGKNMQIHVSIVCQHNSVIVKVQDYGVGIEEDQLDSIFQNTYRVNTLKTDGYGIGLSLVNHVCDLCHGFVWVDSQVDQGSTFYLSFPCVDV